MKFKVIFMLFNVVILVSFLVIYFMPLIMLGWDYTRVFWGRNWGLPILFIAIIGLLNAYFVINWKLFSMLEREDWPALIEYLERRIYEKKFIIAQQVRILVNAYLVRSDLAAIEKLESFIKEQKPRILPRFALAFGIPYLLRNDSEEMERYFAAYADSSSRDGAWLRWHYGFALILQGKKEQAQDNLVSVCEEKTEPVLTLLATYLLDSLNPENSRYVDMVSDARTRLQKRFTPTLWAREVERSRNNIHVVILSKLVEEATDWLFGEKTEQQRRQDETVH
jgi:hypothetical protein